MTTYADVKKQIALLEKKAADLRKVEVTKVVANIREQMAKYELTVDDITPVKSSAKGKVAIRHPKVKVGKPAKYMDPKTGKTWTGHGKAPAWIAVATKRGRRDDYLIEKIAQAVEAKPSEKPQPKASVIASKATRSLKKVAPKKPKAVAKNAASTVKQSAPATKAKEVAPVKMAAKKAPAKGVAKAKAKAKAAMKSAGATKPPKKALSKPLATQPQSAAVTPPTGS